MLKPPPLIVTVVPTDPEVGLSEIVDVTTVNVTEDETSLLGVPVTLILYVPGDTLPTVNVKLSDPPVMPQFPGVTPVTRADGATEQLVSPVLNPLPVTCTSVPTGPLFTLSDIVGLALAGTAASAETNTAVRAMSRVTMSLARRKAVKSKHSSES